MNICAIFPHPDDAVLNAGGTLARWAAEGHAVTAVCCTRGDLGTLRRDQSAADLAGKRAAELRKANGILGVTTTEILDFPDGGLLDPTALRAELVRCLRQYRPERVLTLDPWAAYEVHPDHITIGRLASEAAAFSCFPLLHPEQLERGFEPHNAREVWYMGLLGRPPNTFVSIGEQLPRKVEALLSFEATLDIIEGLYPGGDAGSEAAGDSLRERTSRWIEAAARQFGKPVGLAAAEPFIVQRCAPGHFDNLSELHAAMLGQPTAPPRVVE